MSAPATAEQALKAIERLVEGRTPEYERLSERQGRLWGALEERLDDDEGRQLLVEFDALVGELSSLQHAQGFRFGYRLGSSGLLNGEAS